MSRADFHLFLDDADNFAALVHATFDACDTDYSGFIERRELRKAMNEVLRKAGLGKMNEDLLDDKFDQYDFNGDGRLNRLEFSQFIHEVLVFYADTYLY